MKMPNVLLSVVCLSLASVPLAIGCSSAPPEADVADDSAEAISTSSSLIGSFARAAGANDPIRGTRFFREAPGKPLRFVLDLDPLAVPGICDPVFPDQCVRSRLDGKVTKVKGNASAGSFTLVAADPPAVPNEAMPFYGNYTFTRVGKTLALHSAQGSWTLQARDKDKGYCIFSTDCIPQLPDERCVERSCDAYTCSATAVAGCDPTLEPLTGIPTGMAGAWKVTGTTPAGVYATIDLSAGTLKNGASKGTFTAKRSPTGPTVTGTYDVGPPNEMIGLAPWFFHESGGTDVQLFIGSIRRDATGKLTAISAVLASAPSQPFFYERQ
jgi:hypothetical protein